jgi:hypothetical protein
MQWPRFRPRFALSLDVPAQAFIDAMRRHAQHGGTRIIARVLDRDVELHLPVDEQRVFTPVLHVQVREEPQGTSTLRGRFAPHPHLWTFVMALYFLLAMFAVAGLVYAASQIILHGALWSAWSLPIALALGGFIHGAVLIGQGLAADQMHALRGVVERVAEETTRALDRQG